MLLAPFGPCIPKICSEGFLNLRADMDYDLYFIVRYWFHNENPFPSMPNYHKVPDKLIALLSANYLDVNCYDISERLLCFILIFGTLNSSYLDLPILNHYILLDHI